MYIDEGEKEQPRVLSLLSAASEIVCRLGCSHLLVGRSHGCDDPPLVTTLPVATAPRVDPNASSSELDLQVRVQSASGGPIYQINNELVTSAQPTVIITQEQCRICAVTPDDLNEACDKLPPTAKLVTIMPVSLEDVLGDVTTIANALGVPDRGTRLVAHIKSQLSAIQSTALNLIGELPKPKVAHVEWLAPLMGSGYWIAECVEFAGGTMVHGHAGGHSQTIENVQLLSDADYIIIAPCGFNIERSYEELKDVYKEWQNLPAVKNGRVAVADGNKYFNRSSVASIIGSAEIVAEVIHPELRGMYGHHGARWVRYNELSDFCGRSGAEPARKDVVLAQGVAENVDANKSLEQTATTNNHEAVEHVKAQVAALRSSDYNAAFQMNSSANQKRLVSADKFKDIVTGWPSFRVLTLQNSFCDFRADMMINGPATCVQVDAKAAGSDEILHFAFDLSRNEDGEKWETDGVRIQC